jgi:outer membrane protein TolC
MVWNVLDFGVSYVQARQQGDQVLISEERRRKVVQNIVQDVRYAYWRAVSAERLLPKMDSLMLKAHSALTRAKMLEKMRLQPPLQSLNYQKALLEINRQMWLLRQDLASAKTELSTLMNLKPGTDYELVDGDYAENLPPPLEASIEKLEDLALHQRPELIEEHYQARISASEIRKVMLRMLPGLEFSAGTHTNSNRFLYNQDWLNAGYRISWNLFNLLSAGTRIREAETQLAVDEMRRLSLSMAILTQVRLAHQRYTLAQESYAVSSDMMDVETRIQGHMKAEQLAKTGSELEAIRSQASALIVEMQRDLGYAELQNAFSQIVNSLGIDPLQETDINGDIATLASDISNSSMLIGLRLLAAE